MAIIKGLKRISEVVWEVPVGYQAGMRTAGWIYASEKLMDRMEEAVAKQLANVAMLPGIVGRAMCMPDGHWGYGFPIGGVAAMDAAEGVISPGGIGFDINCGMRLLRSNLVYDEVGPKLEQLVDRLFQRVPAGIGAEGLLKVSRSEFCQVLEEGAKWCVDRGYGRPDDLQNSEHRGCAPGAKVGAVSEKAVDRGFGQLGTLGSGNHYLEIQVVHEKNIFDTETAKAFGIDREGQIVVMFHCGSRGFGHQVATDYLQKFLKVMKSKYDYCIPDRELCCVPLQSKEGQDYFAAMNCAINMAYANRQLIAHRIREVFSEVFGKSEKELGMDQVYDVAHNTASLEEHEVDGKKRKLLVHRKGATRALGPGSQELPSRYRAVGQPIIIGGSMETGSYLLAGQEGSAKTFHTTAHGSGRLMSRREAKRQFQGQKLQESMKRQGIYVRCKSYAGLAEEAGGAYKNVDEVVRATEQAGISKRVVRLAPIGNIKG